MLDGLEHLHDPVYLQTLRLAHFAPADAQARTSSLGRALGRHLLEAVEALGPDPGISADSQLSLGYQVLKLHFVDGLEARPIQSQLGISRSMYYVERDRALDAVASYLWERWIGDGQDAAEPKVAVTPLRLARLERPSHNLPLQLTSFVGREKEMAEVRRLLGTTRLLTLTGTGGCGKTRLAVEAARCLLAGYPDGAWLVLLAPIADEGLVAPSVAACLGVREATDEPTLATLIRHLRATRALLILDNCEHLLDACASLSERLVESCPCLSILATSRQPLGISGEVTLRVPSLESPPVEGCATREALLEAVLSHDATRLFLDRASAALPAFAATSSNASAIGEVCRRLDGIPLAIELAAARVRAFSPDEIASRLDHDFHLLTGGSRTTLPRQQTLKATIDWSFGLLSGQERELLRRLAVFAGGFSLEAAEGVCVGNGIEEADVVNLLAELVDRSLVEVETREGDTRYRLLEPIRQYAWHQLEESGGVEGVRRRHVAWFAKRFQALSDDAEAREEARWQRTAAREIGDVRAALQWCLDHDPTTGLALAASSHRYWQFHGFEGESRRWLDDMLPRAPERTLFRAEVLFLAAAYAITGGDFERCISLSSESVSIYLELGYEVDLGQPLNMLGQATSLMGDHVRARSYLEQAEAVGRRVGNEYSLTEALAFLAYDAWLAGELDRAHHYLDQAVAASLASGSAFDVGYAHYLQGGIACTEGELEAARAHLAAAVEYYRSIANDPFVGWCLCLLGYVSLRAGDHDVSRAQLSEGLRLTARAAQKSRMARCLVFLAFVASREGDPAQAARLLGAAWSANRHVRTWLSPDQLADLDNCLFEARAALGEDAFAKAWAEGQAMTLEQAVEYALANEERL